MAKFKVGDKLIYGKGGWFEEGTVVTVLKVDSDDKEMPYLVSDGEYNYWVEADSVSDKLTKNQRITTLEQKVADLQAEVDALKKKAQAVEYAPEIARKERPLTPNQKRKAIIDDAKAFVEDVTKRMSQYGHGNKLGEHGEITTSARGWVTKAEFIVNAEKRTVVALARGIDSGNIYAKGIAKCAPDDVFNADIGKAIALGRALGLDVSKFEQAVQPTEVVVGHVVSTDDCRGRTYIDRVFLVENYGGSRIAWFDGEKRRGGDLRETSGRGTLPKIIEDTEAQY